MQPLSISRRQKKENAQCVSLRCFFLTIHLSLEELDEGLREGLNPFVHDVVTLLHRVFIVQELNILLLQCIKYTNAHKNGQSINTKCLCPLTIGSNIVFFHEAAEASISKNISRSRSSLDLHIKYADENKQRNALVLQLL